MKKNEQLITILHLIKDYDLRHKTITGLNPEPWIEISIILDNLDRFNYSKNHELVICGIDDGNGWENVHFSTFIEILRERA